MKEPTNFSEFSNFSEVVEEFLAGRLQIYVGLGTAKEFEELGKIMEIETDVRPFDGSTYEEYFTSSAKSYPYIFCKQRSRVTGYDISGFIDHTLTAKEVIKIYKRKPAFSESDFDDVF